MDAITAFFTSFKLYIMAAVVIGIFAFGYHRGATGVQADWDKAKDAQKIADQAALLTAQFGVITTERKYADNTNEVSNDFIFKKSLIDSNYAAIIGGLPGNGASAPGFHLPAITPGKPRNGGSTCADGLPGRRKEIAALLRQADLQTQQLLAYMAWARKNGMMPKSMQVSP